MWEGPEFEAHGHPYLVSASLECKLLSDLQCPMPPFDEGVEGDAGEDGCNGIPTRAPTSSPTLSPTTNYPTFLPTSPPSEGPTFQTLQPTRLPTPDPTLLPSDMQDYSSLAPTLDPSEFPTIVPSLFPSTVPTIEPTMVILKDARITRPHPQYGIRLGVAPEVCRFLPGRCILEPIPHDHAIALALAGPNADADAGSDRAAAHHNEMV